MGADGAPSDAEQEKEHSGASRLEHQWALGSEGDRRAFKFVPYRANYLMPVTYRSEPGSGLAGDAKHVELAFQISFKTRLWADLVMDKGAMWFGYTQQSFWQAYRASSAFRETNYEPEIRYAYELNGSLWGWRPRVVTVGLNHQSNGRSGADSRSWNRVTAGLAMERGPLSVAARGWTRLPDYGRGDDNPGIVDRVGRGELRGRYDAAGHGLEFHLRGNLDVGDPRGAVSVSYAFPLDGALHGYVRAFHGYGDSLIDYHDKGTRVGVGIALSRW